MNMQLKVLLPSEVFLEQPVQKVVAEAANGSFCLLPRHIDFLAALVPGLLSYTDLNDEEWFVAVDEGMLVKKDRDVLVSTRHAIGGADLGSLRETVRRQFGVLDERERVARSAMAKLESDFIRRFLELEQTGP